MATVVAGASPSLPVFDYAKLVRPRTSKDPKAILGFVYLQNHSIPPAAQQQLFDHAKRFFAQSDSEKVKIETGEAKAFHGWFSPQRTSRDQSKSDQKEAFDIGHDSDPTRPNQWPSDWPEFRIDMTAFFEKCHEVHLELFAALAEQVDLKPDFFLPYVEKRDHFFRVLYYPETSGQSFKDRFRASPRTDYGTLTCYSMIPMAVFKSETKLVSMSMHLPWPMQPSSMSATSKPVGSTTPSNRRSIASLSPALSPDLSPRSHRLFPLATPIVWFGHPNRDAFDRAYFLVLHGR